MKFLYTLLLLSFYSITTYSQTVSVVAKEKVLKLSKDEYVDRVRAMWLAQMVAVHAGWDFEHAPAAVKDMTDYSPKRYQTIVDNGGATVDDDWYYEMVALEGFEKYGEDMSVEELGQQWLDTGMGTWGSAFYTRQALLRGVRGADAGSPKNNRMWFTVGNQNRSDLYAMISPGLPNLTASISRDLGHVNSYAEGTDGGVLIGTLESMAFYEKDIHQLVKKSLTVLAPESPHRICGETIVRMAEEGHSWCDCAKYVEERWGIEYPGTNSAVWNAGLALVSLWFGNGDFMNTLNIAWQSSDYSDADCVAANAATVLAAMYGTKVLPEHMVKPLNDRVKGEWLGFLKLKEPVDMTVTSLAERTEKVGIRKMMKNNVRVTNDSIFIPVQTDIITQQAEIFHPNEFVKYWDEAWTMERAGYGAPGGGVRGIRGGTFIDDEVLVTYPRDEVRGVKLQTVHKVSDDDYMFVSVAADPGRKWLLTIYVDHDRVHKSIIDGGEPLTWDELPENYPQPLLEYEASKKARQYKDVKIDLSEYKGKEVTIRMYQSILVRNGFPGNAYWKPVTFKN